MIERVACRVHVGCALALLAALGCGDDRPTDPDATVGRAFGDRCDRTEDCESRLCLRVDSTGGVCTRFCAARDDCPEGESWGCVHPAELPAPVCGCVATSLEEICGDGLDNDCDGATDDCRICAGRPVPNDHPMHCGRCDNACRFDQSCDDGACSCTDEALSECAARCVDVQTDVDHCGRCGEACHRDQSCAGGMCTCPSETPTFCEGQGCVDTGSDPRHCGRCDAACGAGRICSAGVCRCANAATPDYCDAVGCVDLSNDPRHCGECGRACAGEQTCVSGVCTCPRDTPLACGASCVDPESDPTHCGSCDRVCTSPETCVGGECRCAFDGHAVCSGVCRDLRRDSTNCGSCGRLCAPGERCAAGSCVCDSGLACGGRCIAEGDPTNCGACGRACPAGQICAGGECACPAIGFVPCGAACVDLARDPRHCGRCDAPCGPTEVCSAGFCACPAGSAFCPATGDCRDLSSDRNHCGACGRACSAAQTCVAGSCVCPSSGTTYCPSVDACVVTSSDVNHCGGCDVACRPTERCIGSSCRCDGFSEVYCESEGRCVDTFTNENHCGSCDRGCPPDSICSSARCICDDPTLVACTSRCSDLTTDSENCRTCGNVCPGIQRCVASACVCPAPTVGTELFVRTTASGSIAQPSVASDGANVALVWNEGLASYLEMRNRDGTSTGFTPVDLIAATTSTTRGRYAPKVVWNGTEYGVAWSVGLDPSGGLSAGEIWLQRFTAAGASIAAPRRVVAASVAGNGATLLDLEHSAATGYGILYRESGVSSSLRFRHLGATGATPAAPVVIEAVFPEGAAMDVNPSGEVAILYWRRVMFPPPTRYFFMFARVSEASALIGAPLMLDPTTVFVGKGDIVWDGTSWTAVAQRSTGLVVMRGTTTLPTVLTLRRAADPGSAGPPRLALEGDQLEVTVNHELRRLRISPTTVEVLDPVLTVTASPVAGPSADDGVAPTFVGPGHLLLAWADELWTHLSVLPVTLSACP